jgi:hypothetical protein
MDGLQRITFRFGTEFEIRYLPGVPEAGDFVTRQAVLWVVVFVASNGTGMTVMCEIPDGDGHVRRVA